RAVVPDDFDALPVDPAREAGAERLHRRLLGGEPRGKRRREVALPPAVGDLAFGEDVAEEAVAVALYAVGDPLDLHGVHATPYNVHGLAPSYMTLPAVPEPFRWIDAPWGHALSCRALDGVAPHLFSTRQLE